LKYFTALLFILAGINSYSESITSMKVSPSGKADTIYIDAEIRIPEGFYISENPDYFNIHLSEDVPGLTVLENIYPQAKSVEFNNPVTGKTDILKEFSGTVQIRAVLGVDTKLIKGNSASFTFIYQLCDDTVCYPPEEEIHSLRLEMLSSPENNPGFLKLMLYLLFAFAGGIILNLTPCVLPVLSVKALHLIKQSGMAKKKIFSNSLFYTAGVLVSMLVLAIVTIILKLSGEYAGFSFQNQDPMFNTFLVVLLFSFALSLFGVFSIRIPGTKGTTKAAEISARSGYSGSFFSGVFAILLGVSCTAPLLAPALGFAFSLPYFWIIVFFLTAGAGLAFPFLLLGIYPKIISKFPKPGKWMDIFKEVLAFGLLIFAVDRLSILLKLTGTIVPQLFYLLAAAAALWQYGKLGSPRYKIITNVISLIAAIAVLSAGFAIIAARQTSQENSGIVAVHDGTAVPAPWQKFSPDLLEEYRAAGSPVFIDFTADWCLNCQINKRLVLRTSSIEEAFTEKDVQLLVADFTARDADIAEMLKQYGKAGVPVYAFYPAGSERPVFLPELLTKKMIYNMLDKHTKDSSDLFPESSTDEISSTFPGQLPVPFQTQ
jgi:thiol:disulfide interchange protein